MAATWPSCRPSSTATNQNAWIEAAKAMLPDKFPNINLVATVYGDDDSVKSTERSQGPDRALSEPQGHHRADHRRRRCRRPGRHRHEPDRQGQRHRPRAAVRVQAVHRQWRFQCRRAVEPDRPRLLGRARSPTTWSRATTKAEPGATFSIGRVGEITLDDTNSAAMAAPVPVRQDQHRRSSPRSIDPLRPGRHGAPGLLA